MSRFLILLLALGAQSLLAVQPNVLLIVTDDQGFGDFGFNGNTHVHTPNLDQLAAESALYRQFVVSAACSPSRSALWTGRDHLLTGVWGVPPRANMHEDEARMPAYFQAMGYNTSHIGKLDCVKMGKQWPETFGWLNYLGGGGYEHRDPMLFERANNRRGKGWTVDLWTDLALSSMRQSSNRPWFISLAYIIPHMPWECDESFSAPFLAKGHSKELAACYGSIAQLDASIGRLLKGLKECGQDQRTIVVFLSDNGATGPEAKHSTEDGLVTGADWVKRNPAKLRGHKATVWENGIRVPLLVRWPGRIRPGERKQFGSVEDVLPTLLDLAGVKPDLIPHQPLTGLSLRDSLLDANKVTEHPPVLRLAIAGPGAPRQVADGAPRRFEDHHLTLRGARFKYHSHPGGRQALYDLETDPGETRDVQKEHPEITSQMMKESRQRWEAILASGRAFQSPATEKTPEE